MFIGSSADDVSTSGVLAKLRALGIEPSEHFWITERNDAATYAFCNTVGIDVITYDASGGHAAVTTALLDDLRTFQSRDTPAAPVQPRYDGNKAISLPPPTLLVARDPEFIRQALNSRARQILGGTGNNIQRDYENFCTEYDEAIDRSWYLNLTSDPPRNIFFSYLVAERIGRGAFGTVYKALDNAQNPVAIKLLLKDVRSDGGMLDSFRRGVHSMQILAEHNVRGMVRFQATYELPPCVVMEFVPGLDLYEAIKNHLLESIEKILAIAQEIVDIVRSAHNLPERVLHRDLRPQNIMLKNFYSSDDTWEVIVLDFDLSWHWGAMEESIQLDASAYLGYLSPEQLNPGGPVSTRSTLVDSYGMGMTLYYLATRRHPQPNDTLADDWPSRVRRHVYQARKYRWKSSPNRLSRLIWGATRPRQTDRIDLSVMRFELERLRKIEADNSFISDADLLAEELAARAFPERGYDWDDTRAQGTVPLVRGAALRIIGDTNIGKVILEVDRSFTGDQKFESISKFWPAAIAKGIEILRKAGWSIQADSGYSYQRMTVRAEVEGEIVSRKIDAFAESIRQMNEQVALN